MIDRKLPDRVLAILLLVGIAIVFGIPTTFAWWVFLRFLVWVYGPIQ